VKEKEKTEMNSLTAFIVEVSGHKLEPSQTRVFYLIFLFYKMLFMNRLEFSCFVDFFMYLKNQSMVFFKIRLIVKGRE